MMPSVTIGELTKAGAISIGDGYRTKRSEHGRPGFRILRVADVADGEVHLDGSDFVSVSYADQIGSKLSQPEDVLLTTKGTVGRVAVMPAGEQVVYSPQLCYFRVLPNDVLDRRYLRYWFKSGDFSRQAGHRMNNTDMAAYINLADVRSLEMQLPEIRAQRGIAEVLGALDDKIAANRKLQDVIRQFLVAHFRALNLQPSGDAEPISVTDLVDINPKLPKPASDNAVYLDMKNLPQGPITVQEWDYRAPRGGARFQNGDTLLARITPCLQNGKVGYVDFLGAEEVGVGSTEYVVLRSRPGVPKHLPFFIASSARFRAFAIPRMIGTSGRQRLSPDQVAGYEVHLPRQAEVDAFGLIADPLMEQVRATTEENRRLAGTRDALLPLLMSGRVRVRDVEDTVGELV